MFFAKNLENFCTGLAGDVETTRESPEASEVLKLKKMLCERRTHNSRRSDSFESEEPARARYTVTLAQLLGIPGSAVSPKAVFQHNQRSIVPV